MKALDTILKETIEGIDALNNHPEAVGNEVFIGNFSPESIAELPWKTMRVGTTALTFVGRVSPATNILPVFVDREEIAASCGMSGRLVKWVPFGSLLRGDAIFDNERLDKPSRISKIAPIFHATGFPVTWGTPEPQIRDEGMWRVQTTTFRRDINEGHMELAVIGNQ